VRVHLGASEGEVEVTVADDGIGIPGVDQLKVGERFFRASNAVEAHIPGTGLGLRMVQAIVSNHEGYFGLASEEGHGTTATVRLPLQRAAGEADQEQSVPRQR
jgi:signal transduction histidine kinase